jgi:hypothetical protein
VSLSGTNPGDLSGAGNHRQAGSLGGSSGASATPNPPVFYSDGAAGMGLLSTRDHKGEENLEGPTNVTNDESAAYLQGLLGDDQNEVHDQTIHEKWGHLVGMKKGSKVLADGEKATVVKTTAARVYFVLNGRMKLNFFSGMKIALVADNN